jgi:hypothetical protein
MPKTTKPKSEKPTVRGYKVFNPDFTCNGMQYKEGETFTIDLPIKICNRGLHFCTKASHCFSYYNFDPNNIVCEVEALGETQLHNEDSKVCTNILKVVRRLTWREVLVIANEGKDNTGHSNSGDWNSGDSNSGNRNSGDWNSGDRNSGDRNSGNWNSGDRNSGDRNSGYRNSGDRNSGNWNSGDRNSGNWNSGDRNSGNWNSGDSNSGYRNSGYRNSGDSNSGNWNSGDRNSGNWNSGDRNSGDSNSGYRNSGAFCLDENPKLVLFDKLTDISVRDWENSEVVRTMNNLLETTIWVYPSSMTGEEKKAHPKYETTDGYLKTKTMHEAWKDMWGNLNEKQRKLFTDLPHFDAVKFEKITGIKV